MKTIYLIRGLPGSGKTTFVKNLQKDLSATSIQLEADQFFYTKEGVYNFNLELLGAAHRQCQENFKKALQEGVEYVFVSNTFTTEKELKPYLEMSSLYPEYVLVSLVVENRHGHSSVHNVPEETLQKMENRFSYKLRG